MDDLYSEDELSGSSSEEDDKDKDPDFGISMTRKKKVKISKNLTFQSKRKDIVKKSKGNDETLERSIDELSNASKIFIKTEPSQYDEKCSIDDTDYLNSSNTDSNYLSSTDSNLESGTNQTVFLVKRSHNQPKTLLDVTVKTEDLTMPAQSLPNHATLEKLNSNRPARSLLDGTLKTKSPSNESATVSAPQAKGVSLLKKSVIPQNFIVNVVSYIGDTTISTDIKGTVENEKFKSFHATVGDHIISGNILSVDPMPTKFCSMKPQNINATSGSHVVNRNTANNDSLSRSKSDVELMKESEIIYNFRCDRCQLRFTSLQEEDSHMVKHASEKPYKCKGCGNKFSCRKELEIHISEVCLPENVDADKHVCAKCGEIFEGKSKLKNHRKQHISSEMFKCKFCDVTFKFWSYFVPHYKSHLSQTTFKCDECGKQYRSESGLQNHLESEHSEDRQICNICGKSLKTRDALRLHLNRHSLVKPHACKFCSKTFARKCELKNHTNLHTGNKPYMCDTCGRKFRMLKFLRLHTMTHKGEKPHKCDICGRAFGQKNDLVRHGVVHSKAKPFQCPICSRSFAQKASIIRHTRSVHKKLLKS